MKIIPAYIRTQTHIYIYIYLYIYIFAGCAYINHTGRPRRAFQRGESVQHLDHGRRTMARESVVLARARAGALFFFLPLCAEPTAHPPKTRLSRWLNFIFRPHPLSTHIYIYVRFFFIPPLEFLFRFAESICQAFITGRRKGLVTIGGRFDANPCKDSEANAAMIAAMLGERLK